MVVAPPPWWCVHQCRPPYLGYSPGSLNGTQFASNLSPVWDSDGNLIQFTFDSADGYFRLSCKGIGETSVITINETIA